MTTEIEPHPVKEHVDSSVRNSRTVLQMRIAGYSFDEIAEILCYADEDAVRKELERGAKVLLKENKGSQAFLRSLCSKQLERMTRAVWNKAIDPESPEQFQAQQRALANIDRFIRLNGLDAPVEHKIEVTPTEKAIADMVAALAEMGQLPEEMNIFEAELVEDIHDVG